jgi:riboflavin biosynthesis pyrimidine reductase
MSELRDVTFPGASFELLFERDDLPDFDLPVALRQTYGGRLGFRRPRLFATFVESLDGVVTLEGAGESGHVISGNSQADRFVMGLLRACADAVIVGAGTLRASPKHLWTPAKIFPPAAEAFAELRRSLGLGERPKLVVVTASGNLDGSWPALRDALVATTPAGAARVRGVLPATARVVAFPSSAVEARSMDLAPVLELLHSEGQTLLLTEGGPTLFGQLLDEDLLDELFLTISPRLFGRRGAVERKALVEGVDLRGKPLALASARKHGSHLFLRYGDTLGA